MKQDTKPNFALRITQIELKDGGIYIAGRLDEGAGAGAPLPEPTEPEAPLYRASDAQGDYLIDGPEAVTVQEASSILNCSETTIDNMRNDGRLRSYYRGRNVRLKRAQVMEARQWWSVAKGKV